MDNPTDVIAGAAAPAAAANEPPAPAAETVASEPKPEAAAPTEAAPTIPETAAAPIVPPQAPPVMPRAAVLPPKPEAPATASPEAAVQPAAGASSPNAASAPPAARDARSRFALLAACVAVAASLGAIGGSVAVGGLSREAPAAAAAVRPESNDEARALKDSVAQLRIQVRTLSDNVAALKVGVTAVNTTANTQFAKISETLERVERSREQHRTAALPPASETTGSIAAAPASVQPAAPPAEAKPAKLPIVEDWIVRRVYDGAALVEGRRYGVVDIAPGESLPGLGRVQEIRREDGRWVVVTPKGLIVQRR